tara:strand:+ start:2928 stop:4046 length:1119 start_codon:yes stop_codon:yes gene_type:complete
MPFEETQVGGQHSQEMTIVSVQDDYLKCTMQSINHFGEAPVYKFYRIGPDASAGTKTVDVSRPSELSKSTVVANGNEWVNVNSYSGGSGEYKLEIPYEAGQKIMVTKGIEIPLTTSSNSGISGLETNSTVDIFVDENREGRSWHSPASASGDGGSGASGVSGFTNKCIVLCEGGVEISGEILFKSGCEGAPITGGSGTGTGINSTGTNAGYNASGIVTGAPITVYLHCGNGNNSPILASWTTGTEGWIPTLAGDSLSNFQRVETAVTEFPSNYVAVNIPTGAKVEVFNAGGFEYIIPDAGGPDPFIEAFGNNGFQLPPAQGDYNVEYAISSDPNTRESWLNYSIVVVPTVSPPNPGETGTYAQVMQRNFFGR